jgi:F-type H+-transporting ATPase subunit epsilon
MANDKLLQIEIVTPQKTVFAGKAQSITVPGTKAPFQVLINHAPIVSSLELGAIKIVDDNSKTTYYATTKGFIEVSRNLVSVLVESADESSAINSEAVAGQISELKAKIKNSPRQEAEELNYQLKIYENQLKVAKYH